MKKKSILLSLALVVVLVIGAVPALAQVTTTVSPRPDVDRSWPPAWVDMTVDELKAQVEQRVADRIERIDSNPNLSVEKKAALIAGADDLLAAVAAAESNPEVIGLVISRAQLEAQGLRAERNGTRPAYEAHLAADIERAQRRLERLTKITGWAGAAGEDVAAIEQLLDQAAASLDVSVGDGTVAERHDAVHISLASMIEAAVGLDGL
jgi:hypothetical protein